jgi:L-alanine-DL-glutamate epimerase-like enolase superfamily enzyme
MKITSTEIVKLTIPMEPFVIATETCFEAKNIYLKITTDSGLFGVGECSAFPMLVGETQETCFAVAKDLARIIKGKNPIEIYERMNELHAYIAFNSTIKSAFDMALHDIASKEKQIPLYQFLGGVKKKIQTDLTIGINTPENMASTAIKYVKDGVKIIKVKLGKKADEDIERIKQIRSAIGNDITLRVDVNQGWSFDTAVYTLKELKQYNIQFCEQPIHHHYDSLLPALKKQVQIPIMADESVFDHFDAERLIKANGCDSINIKLAKSGGILEAIRIANTAESFNIPCMLGGMTESRLALTAKVHLAMSHQNIKFYDLDTCLLGQKEDPVLNGAKYNNYFLEIDETPGIGADVNPDYIATAERLIV